MHTKGKKIGFKVDTFFEEAKLTYKQIWRLSFYWAHDYPIEMAEYLSQISHPTVVAFYAKCRRNVCTQYFVRHLPQFGGNNLRVQADEIFFTKAHGGKGRRVRQHPFWVFGIVELGMFFCLAYCLCFLQGRVFLGLKEFNFETRKLCSV